MNASFFRGPVGLVTLGLVSVTVCVLLLLPAVGHGYLEAPGNDWIIGDDHGDGGGGGGGGRIDWHTTGNTTTGGEVLGTLNPLPLNIVTNAVPKINILPAGGVNVLATPPFSNDLTLAMGNSLMMPGGFWDGIAPFALQLTQGDVDVIAGDLNMNSGFWDGSGASANPFQLQLTLGDVDVRAGNLLMFSGFWDGSGTTANPFALELTQGSLDVVIGNVNVATGAINMPFLASWNAAGLGDVIVEGSGTAGGGNVRLPRPDPVVGGGNVIIGPPTNNSPVQYNNLLVNGDPADPGSGRVGIGPVAQNIAGVQGIPQARLHVEGVAGSPETLLHVEGVGNFTAGVENEHIAVFRSLVNPTPAAGTFSTPDGIAIVLDVQLPGAPPPAPPIREDHNFITFIDSNDPISLGAIEARTPANAADPQILMFQSTAGADFAEGLPKLVPEENIEPGMIVGVYGGYVTKDTVGADHVMVISTAPAFLGSAPPDGEEDNYAEVAFMGRVPVLVRAPVSSGDFIMASGMGDGTAVAVNPADIGFEDIGTVVGTAWSDLEGGLLGYVDVVVGVNNAVGAGQAMPAQIARIRELQLQLDQTQSQLAAMSARLRQLETAIDN